MRLKRNDMIKVLAVAAIASLLSVYIYAFYIYQEPKHNHEGIPDEDFQIDDRINPYVYQGLTVEILRMRNRNLLNKMFEIGSSYKKAPTFYYVIEVDGEVGDSREVQAAGGVTGEGTFTTWDTILQECRTNFQATEGQSTSEISLTIMELQKSGLLGLKEESVEKLRINLIFDYRTGHWTGDDYLKDSDGYGHVLGDEYEIWFNIYESDYDHDKIPYWTEVNIYHTDPTYDDGKNDPDNDGIPSWWEWKYGYDPLTWDNHAQLDPDVDGVENDEEYMMNEYFSDPFHPDVYIEVDFMEKNPNKIFDLKHIMFKETQQMIIEKMSEYGISVYFDDGWPDGPLNGGGEFVEFRATIDETVGGHMARWYKHNFADERKGVFRYFQMVNNAGVITASEYNTFDHILMDSSPLKVFTRHFAYTIRQRSVTQAKGTLHELGHTMGLVPVAFVGIDNMPQGNYQFPETLTDEEWARVNTDYESIMNYNYVFVFNPRNILKSRTLFTFSDGSNGEYDFDDESHFYLPTFQMDAAIVESPRMREETFDDFIWTDKNPDPIYQGWEYDKNLTEEYKQYFSELRFDIDNAVAYDYRVYVKTDESADGRTIRIYTKPVVKPMPALWSLLAEGGLDKDHNLSLYSYDQEVEEIKIQT